MGYMPFKMKYKNLEEVVGQLRSAVVAHGKQADIIENHIDDMQSPSPAKGYKSAAQRKAVHASKADGGAGNPNKMVEKSPMTKKGPCWSGYEMIGMKEKNGRQVPNCVPKK